MRSLISNYYTKQFQEVCYDTVNDVAKGVPFLGRILSVEIAVMDVATETLRHVANMIEQLAMAVINLFGALFSKHCSPHAGIYCLEDALLSACHIPISLVTAPFKFVSQIVQGLWNPRTVRSTNPEAVHHAFFYVIDRDPIVYGYDDEVLMRA